MSYGLDWWISGMPTCETLQEHLAAICRSGGIDEDAFRVATTPEGFVASFKLRRAQLLDVRAAFGDSRGWTLESMLRDMANSVHHPEDGCYELSLLVWSEQPDEDPPIPAQVVVTTNEDDNHAGWVAIELLAVVLVERLGLHPDDENREADPPN